MASITEIMREIKSVCGITQILLLDSEQKEFIAQVEQDIEEETGIDNVGVKEVLKRKIVFVATHDTHFRTPRENIVHGKNILSTDFPELNKNNPTLRAIIASPCKEVHEYLCAFIHVEGSGDEEDATLLIGVG